MEDTTTSNHRNHNRRHKLYILPILVILQFVLNCLFIFIIIYHSTDMLKKIDECRRDVDLVKQQMKSTNFKITSHFPDEKDSNSASGEKTSRRNSAVAQKKNDASTHSRRSSNEKSTTYCPFRRKRQQWICSYVKSLQNEVTEQRNKTVHLQNEIERLDNEVKRLDKESEYKSKLQAQLPFQKRNPLRLIPKSGKNGAQSNLYVFGRWKNWRSNCRIPTKQSFCRQFPKPPITKNKHDFWVINYTSEASIKINVLGIYWFSLQLTMENSSSSCAHLISKVSIVMATPKHQGIGFDYVALRSQIPIPFEYTNGNEKVKLYSVSMSGPVKLQAGSKVLIAVALKPEEKVQTGEKRVVLYNINDVDEYNWFSINLMHYMENDS